MVNEWSASRSGHSAPPRKAAGTHWIGGWVDPRAGLDDVKQRKSHPLQRIKPLPRTKGSTETVKLVAYIRRVFGLNLGRGTGVSFGCCRSCYSSTLKIKTVRCSETSVNLYQTTRSYISEVNPLRNSTPTWTITIQISMDLYTYFNVDSQNCSCFDNLMGSLLDIIIIIITIRDVLLNHFYNVL
jgi:hypothetical protein